MANTYIQIGSTVTVGGAGAATIDFTSIPATFTDLLLKYSARTLRVTATDAIYLTLNGSTAGFTSRLLQGFATTTQSATETRFAGYADSAGNTASTFGSSEVYFPNYAGSNNKSFSVDMVAEDNSTTLNVLGFNAGLWSNAAAITSITLTSSTSSNFVQYSTATLYGIKSS
jgi:hypothetical protein